MGADVYDEVVSRAQERVGAVLREKWRLDALIGVGGMAAVYAATHRNGKRAAVKMLHPELSIDANVRGRFLREGYVANKVAHPGAVSVLDDDTADDGSAFLVMDLLEGETLADRAERCGGRLAPDEVLAAVDQLLDVLAAAHAKGIIHRDIKPENLFVTRDGQLKVLDFGIARMKELSTASTATQQGSTMGTPAFMPPEQARGLWEKVDARTDVWAVGACAFTLLTGRLVHQARTANEQLLGAMTARAASLARVLPGLPAQVNEVVDRALAFEKKDRWTDARAMQAAVRVAYQSLIGRPITTAPKLVVPEMPDSETAATIRSSPGDADGAAAATGSALVRGRTGVDVARARPLRKTLLAAIVAGGSLAVALTGWFVIAKVLAPPTPPASANASSAVPPDYPLAADAGQDAPAPPAPSQQPAAIVPDQLPAATTTRSTPRNAMPPAPTKSAAAGLPPAPPADTTDMMDKRR